MVSVLHVMGSAADEQTRQIHDLLIREIGPGFVSSTHTIGSGKTYRNLPTAILQLRRQKPDFTYAWGTDGLTAAVLAGHRQIIFSPDRFAGPRALSWIRTLSDRPGVTMVFPTFTQNRLALSKGIGPDRCQVIPPGVDFGAVQARRDLTLRSALGLAEKDFVLLAPGESSLAAGHEHAVWAAMILNVLDPSCKLLLWGRGKSAERALATARRSNLNDLVTSAEQKLRRSIRFEDLLGVADACLATPTGLAPTLPIAMAMAACVPIVSTVTYALAELLEDRHTALLVPSRSPRALVQRVIDLRADDALRAKIVDNARAEAFEHFSMTKMLDAYRLLMAGESSLRV